MSRPRRHHYLPVFLLSAFQISGGRRVPRVRGIRANGVFEAGVRDVGVETDFHRTEGFFRDPEGLLSRWESEFAAEVKRWPVGPLDERGRATVDKLIPHLRLRSRTLRELGARLMQSFVSEAGRGLEQFVTERRPPLGLRDQVGNLIDEAIRQERAGTWGESARQELLDKAAKCAVKQHAAHWSVLEVARLCRFLFAGDLTTRMLTGAHTMMIVTTLINQRRFEAFGNYQWEIVPVGGDELLLGDVGPLCWYRGERRLKPLYAAPMPLQAVLLPLGPDRFVVGWDGKRPSQPSVALLNQATLELSHEFVVGRWSTDQLEAARSRLGARAAEDTPEMILGIEIARGVPFAAEVARAAADWASSRVEGYWFGTAANESGLSPLERQAERATAETRPRLDSP